MTATAPTIDGIVAAWHARAEDLTSWALARVFVRTDRFGGYYRKDGETHKVTRPTSVCTEQLSRAVLVRHFRAARTDDVVGAHPLPPGDNGAGRWVAADIDAHGEGDDPERNRRYALHVYRRLTEFGFRALLATWETGGYHLWVFFNHEVSGPTLYSFGKWLVRDAGDFGYTEEIETFPKQELVPANGCGNWLRLPGRHHTRDVFATVFDGSAWVEGEEAVEHLLSLTGDSPDLIPEAAAPTEPESIAGSSAWKIHVPADVFAAFNSMVSLDTVVGWHTDRGHRVTRSTNSRVEFIREGKKGKSQSFNVEIRNSVPITYNFSTKAGLPSKKGLSPAQVRCFYETGACDTAAMREFAKVLRKELGWPEPGANGKHEGTPPGAGGHEKTAGTSTAPGFTFGELSVRPGTPRQTEGGKIVVPLTLCRDGKVIDHFQLNDSAAGRRNVAVLIGLHDGGRDTEAVGKLLASVLAWAVERLARPPEGPSGETVHTIVAARVPEMLRFTYRTARGVWSEAEGREMVRADLLAFVPSELLTSAVAGCDAPEHPSGLLRAVKDALEILWADLRRTLKTAAELKEDTAARRAFHDAVVRVWKTTRTWEVDRGKDRQSASRVSLAGMVQRAANEFVNGRMMPAGRGVWRSVREDLDAYWRPAEIKGECVVLLAMRYTLTEQVGVTVQEVTDQKSFTDLGIRYGLFTDTPCVSGRLSDGTRLSVMTPPVSAEILARVLEDPLDEPSTDAEAG